MCSFTLFLYRVQCYRYLFSRPIRSFAPQNSVKACRLRSMHRRAPSFAQATVVAARLLGARGSESLNLESPLKLLKPGYMVMKVCRHFRQKPASLHREGAFHKVALEQKSRTLESTPQTVNLKPQSIRLQPLNYKSWHFGSYGFTTRRKVVNKRKVTSMTSNH